MPSFVEENLIDSYDCVKIDSNDFNILYEENAFSMDNLGIFHMNIRSINSNFDTLLAYLETLYFKFPNIALTETWLSSDLDSFHIPNYKTFSTISQGKRGGIRVFVHNSIVSEKISVACSESFQNLNLKLTLIPCGNISLSVIYRSPNTSKLQFNNDFNEIYSRFLQNKKKVVLLGDFNIDLLNPNETQTSSFTNIMHSMGLIPLITLPTRDPPDSPQCSLIDHIWTNIPPPIKSFVFDTAITDHFPIACIFQLIAKCNDFIKIKFRDFSQRNIDSFLAQIPVEPTIPSIINSNNIDNLHRELFSRLEGLLDAFFPIRGKTISLKKLRSPWLSRPILRCIEKKHRLYKLFKRDVITREYFNIYKNKLRRLLILAKKYYFANRFAEAKNNIKRTWNIINDSLNRSNSKASVIGSLRTNEGHIVNDTLSIGNELNNHFVNVANNNVFGDSLQDSMLELVQPSVGSAVFVETSPPEIASIIHGLKNNNNIYLPTKFLKLCVPIISGTLATLFNACLTEGIYPDQLKKANVTPIFKKGDKSDPGNYRPISVLNDINKIYEELIYTRLTSYIDNKNILSSNQYGFRKHKSTQEACIDLLSSLLGAYTRKQYAICLFIDFSKAFDSIDHTRLLKKLDRYGIRSNILSLFKSYFTNRHQRVLLNGVQSDQLPIRKGVPQGSKLGPILFNLFVNDLSNLPFTTVSPFQYADDTSFAATKPNLPYLVENFNSDMNLFFRWCTANMLSINFQKTKAILITPKQLPHNIPPISIHGTIIDYVAEYRYLGIIIDSKLSFKNHVRDLNSRLSRIAGASYATKNHFTLEAATIFYYSMAYSILSYIIPVWGSASDTYINELQITQNKIVRNLFGNKVQWSHTADLYDSLKILKVANIYKLELGKLVFKVLYMNRYPSLASAISDLSWSHNYNTRKINMYQLPFARVEVDRASTLFAAVNFWNSLPIQIKSCKSLQSFSFNLKKYLLLNFNS